MPRTIQSDGAAKGHPRAPIAEFRKKFDGGVGSPVLNEAQLIQRGIKLTATRAAVVGPDVSTWSTITPPVSSMTWQHFGISNAGKILAVGSGTSNGLPSSRKSLDAGATWVTTGASIGQSACARLSADGQVAIGLGNNQLWLSVDGMASWGAKTLSQTQSASASASGQYLFAGGSGSYGSPRWSNDYGATWTYVSTYQGYWECMSVSPSGQHMIGTGTSAGLVVSSDFGATWAKPSGIAPVAVFVTDDGTIYRHDSTKVYVSANHGATWAQLAVVPSTTGPRSIDMSLDGKYHLRGGASGIDAVLSRDSGATWETLTGKCFYFGCSMSADGLRIIGALPDYSVVTNH